MNTKNYNFQKLTPKDDIDINTYKSAIDFVFQNDDIHIVGITGAYCSGKSSVIESYKKLEPCKKFLHISLANFESRSTHNDNQENSSEKNSNNKESSKAISKKSIDDNIFEGKVLNQLIHQIEPDQIPQTNFRIKTEISDDTIHLNVYLLLVLISTVIFSFGFSQWSSFVNSMSASRLKDILLFSTNPEALLISVPITFAILGYFIYSAFKLQLNKNILKKINVQGNEIEIFEKCEDSYFDKYLNEVLYLFNHTDANAIVFEDMDRYNSIQIFQRLREINTLINHRRDKNNQLRFFFLLRDDIFESKDRTKFFDFIIPIVPIVDSSNSYDQFVDHFRKGNLISLFDDQFFLQDLSLYIDDMRILKNIYNEFVIYNNRIRTIEQDANKLLAIITYKNIFPKDFNNLQLGKGFVYTLFHSEKDLLVKKLSKTYLDEINKLNHQIQKINDEILTSEEEINVIYNNPPKSNDRGPKATQNNIDKQERIELIKMRKTGKSNEFQSKITELKLLLRKIEEKPLSGLITPENIDNFFTAIYINEINEENRFLDIKSNEYFRLLKFLIREGFIDESYSDYMTYFYEMSISRIDKLFLISVTDRKAKEYKYKLKNPELVASRLREINFDNPETLNFNLVDHLAANSSLYSEKLCRLLVQLENNKNFHFLSEYLDNGLAISQFISFANKEWPNLFNEIRSNENFSYSQRKEFVLESIYNSSNDDLLSINYDNKFKDFISNDTDFLNIKYPNVDKLINAFEILEIKFVSIIYEKSNIQLWNEVYKHNFYELNLEMIGIILENEYSIARDDSFIHQNFSLVLQKPNGPLALYIKENIEQYFTLLLQHCKNVLYENEDTTYFVLNNGKISEVNKEKYLLKLKNKISSISKIENRIFWPKLLNMELVFYSDKNVLDYFFFHENKLDSNLVNYINEFGKKFKFDYDEIDEDYIEFSESPGSDFLDAIVTNESLYNEKYEAIIVSLNRYYDEFEFTGIDSDKIDILIKCNTISMNDEILIFMRENYKDNLMFYIIHNIEEYADYTLSKDNFVLSEALAVVNSNINDDYKIAIIENTTHPISIINKNYPDKLETHILTNNLEISDLEELLKNYDKLCTSSQEIVEELIEEHINIILTNEYDMPYGLLKKVLHNESITFEERKKVLSQNMQNLNQKEVSECLKILKMKKFLDLFNGKRPLIPINPTHEKILTTFENNRWITKFDVVNKNNWRVCGRKYKESLFSKLLP